MELFEKIKNMIRPVYVKRDNVKLPIRAHADDGGIDIYSPEDTIIPARGSTVIKTQIRCVLPENTVGMVFPKSGLNMRDILAFGLIDEPYRGEIVVKLYNLGDYDYYVHAGDKITQMVILPVLYSKIVEVSEIDSCTSRGENGFGSTGR